MKKLFLLSFTLSLMLQVSAQSKHGIVTYTTPAGWYETQSGSSIVLNSGKSKGATCRITIFATDASVVNDEGMFIKLLSSKLEEHIKFDKTPESVKRAALNKNICYGTKAV